MITEKEYFEAKKKLSDIVKFIAKYEAQEENKRLERIFSLKRGDEIIYTGGGKAKLTIGKKYKIISIPRSKDYYYKYPDRYKIRIKNDTGGRLSIRINRFKF